VCFECQSAGEKRHQEARDCNSRNTHCKTHINTRFNTQKRGIKKCESLTHMEKASLPFSPLSEHVKETHTHKQESQSGSANFSPTGRRYVKSDLTLANRVVGSEGTVLKGGHPPQSLSAWTQQLRDLARTEQRNGVQCGLSATTMACSVD